jgi:hypothetical protein
MPQFLNEFFYFINNKYWLGIPIDHFVHVIVCFILFLWFRVVFRLKVRWSLLLIVLIGLGKVWFSWGAIIANQRYENPIEKMFDNMLGASLAYLVTRYLRLPRSRFPRANPNAATPGTGSALSLK